MSHRTLPLRVANLHALHLHIAPLLLQQALHPLSHTLLPLRVATLLRQHALHLHAAPPLLLWHALHLHVPRLLL